MVGNRKRRKGEAGKRLLAAVLTAAMLVGAVPAQAFAAEPETAAVTETDAAAEQTEKSREQISAEPERKETVSEEGSKSGEVEMPEESEAAPAESGEAASDSAGSTGETLESGPGQTEAFVQEGQGDGTAEGEAQEGASQAELSEGDGQEDALEGLSEEPAEEPEEGPAVDPNSWVNFIDTGWFTAAGREAANYRIATAEELAGLAAIVNGMAPGIEAYNFENKVILLTADIDLQGKADGSGRNWVPIGAESVMKADFNGQGHTVSNLYCRSSAKNVGLFGSTGRIQKLRIRNGYVEGGENSLYVGLCAGCMGEAADCFVQGSVAGRYGYVGGFAGYPDAITRCAAVTDVTVSEKAYSAGGLAGQVYGYRFTDVYHIGRVEAKNGASAAGIATRLVNYNYVTNAYHVGEVTNASGTGSPIGNFREAANTYYTNDYTYGDAKRGLGKTPEELKGMAETLGGAWMAAPEGENEGYPVLRAFYETGEEASPVIRIKINGAEEVGGLSLQDTVENRAFYSASNISTLEITGGKLTKADGTYLKNSILNRYAATRAVILGEAVDYSEAYPDGLDFYVSSPPANFRFLEAPGITMIKEIDVNASFAVWLPKAETLRENNAFYRGTFGAVELPSLKTIGKRAFYRAEVKNLILTGELPSVAEGAFGQVPPEGASVWVPAGKAAAYKGAQDGDTTDDKWYGYTVRVLPEGCDSVQSLFEYTVDHLPADPADTQVKDLEAVLLAEELQAGLRYSLLAEEAARIAKTAECHAQIDTRRASDITDKIAGLPAPGQVTLEDEAAIISVKEEYDALTAEQKLKVPGESYQKLLDCLKQVKLLGGWKYLVTVDGITGWGNTIEELKESVRLLKDDTGLKEMVVYRGDFPDKTLISELYNYLKAVMDVDVKEGVNVNDGYLDYRFFYNNSRSAGTITLPMVTRLMGGSIGDQYSTKARFALPNVEEIGLNALSGKNIQVGGFLPKLTRSQGYLTTNGEKLIVPRLAEGGPMLYRSTLDSVFVPELKSISDDSFFGYDGACKTFWGPKLESINAESFDYAAVTSLILENPMPSAVSGTFERFLEKNECTVYVPQALAETYRTVEDGAPEDGKWYGMDVLPLETCEAARALLESYIEDLKGREITGEYGEWIAQLGEAADRLTVVPENMAGLEAASGKAGNAAETDAGHVSALIAGLEQIGLSDEAKVKADRAAYDALSPAARKKVTNYELLTGAEEKLEILKADEVSRQIAALSGTVTLENRDTIRKVYDAYLALSEAGKAQVKGTDTLNAAVIAVVVLERRAANARIAQEHIDAIPSLEVLRDTDAELVAAARRSYDRLSAEEKEQVTNLSVLLAAEAKLKELLAAEEAAKTVTVDMERFTVGQGLIIEPVIVRLKPGDTVASVIMELLGTGSYSNDGSATDSFYLKSVKDGLALDAPVQVPRYILDRMNASGAAVGSRAKAGWLGEHDYTGMSGWMYSVGNETPGIAASAYDYDKLQDGDVIRWQFTLWGYGADLGYGSSQGESAYIRTADKDALVRQIALVETAQEKETWLGDEAYKKSYDNAYTVLADMTASQAQVDAAVRALADTPKSTDLGSVTVTVRDSVLRRKKVGDLVQSREKEFVPVAGLGDYQKAFGVLLDQVTVRIRPGMTVQEAIVEALEDAGYMVDYSERQITGIGPVVNADRSVTVSHLAAGDVTPTSRWVMSRNGTAYTDKDKTQYFVKDGDELVLEYSVDGGYDIHVGDYTRTSFGISFDEDVRIDQTYFYIPAGIADTQMTVSRKGAYFPEEYSRYMQFSIVADGRSYESGERVPVTAGETLTYHYVMPEGLKSSSIQTISGTLTRAGTKDVSLKVDILKTAAEVAAMINALPENTAYGDGEAIAEAERYFGVLTDEEKAKISEAARRLAECRAAYDKIVAELKAQAQPVISLLNKLPSDMSKITIGNVETYKAQAEEARAAYDALSEDAKGVITAYLVQRLLSVEARIDLIINGYDAPLGVPTNYTNDFMLSAIGFNLDVGADQEIIFFDTPRVGDDDQAFNRNDLIIKVADPDIAGVEVRTAPNPNNNAELLNHYYLVTKKPGTTTFTVTYPGYVGQTAEMAVHVNGEGESGLTDKLTNIQALARKYDTVHYLEGTDGAEFTFHVNGTGASAEVWQYLGDGKTVYQADENGDITVRLTDGYNPVIVTAVMDGKTVTQAYGVRAKAIRYEITNLTSPGSDVYRAGDKISINVIGMATPIHKVSRIYNPSSTGFVFDTDMPRYDELISGGGQYSASGLEFLLTEAGDWSLYNGHVQQGWFGSGLYSEVPVGIAPPNLSASQSRNGFSSLPDIRLHVEENPDYAPNLFTARIVGGSQVKAGDTVTIEIPRLDLEALRDSHQTTSSWTNDIHKGVTTFKTDIPGLAHVLSEEAQYRSPAFYGDSAVDTLERLTKLTFTVPEDTPEGEYHIQGGYVDVTDGIGYWLTYHTYYKGEITDIVLTVLPSDRETAEKAEAKINALPGADALTYGDIAAVEEAKAAFDRLTEEQKALVSQEAKEKLEAAAAAIAAIKDSAEIYNTVYKAVGDHMASLGTPSVGSVGGEWMAVGLARSGRTVPEGYYANVISYVKEEINDKEQLHWYKSTDNSRIILGLTSAGYDVTDVDGHNLLAGLSDLDYVCRQGINGPIWALIAFDSHGYEIPAVTAGGVQTTRENLIQTILKLQTPDGGWALSGKTADADMTGMALQALAPYYGSNADVKKAVDRALACLSGMQAADGGFGSVDGACVESAAQVAVALTALGINPHTDSRFVKNGHSVIDAICDYHVEGKGFEHTKGGGLNGMATEQGYYALAAYDRFVKGKTRLYDMSDVTVKTGQNPGIEDPENPEKPGTQEPGTQEPKPDDPKPENPEKPGTSDPKPENPGTEKPGTEDPGVNQPGTEDPGTDQPSGGSTGTNRPSGGTSGNGQANGGSSQTAGNRNQAGQTVQSPGGQTRNLGTASNNRTASDRKPLEKEQAAAKVSEGLKAVLSPGNAGSGLPKDFTKLTDGQLAGILQAYRDYMALDDEEKALVEGYEEFAEILEKLGAVNHRDPASGISVEGLGWNIRVTAANASVGDGVRQKLQEALGEGSEVLKGTRISFTDLLADTEFRPGKTVTVRLPRPEAGEGRTLVIACVGADGKLLLIEPEADGEELVFQIQDGGDYYVAAYDGVWEGLLENEEAGEGNDAEVKDIAPEDTSLGQMLPEDESPSAAPFLWGTVLALCAAGLAAVIIYRRRQKGEETR